MHFHVSVGQAGAIGQNYFCGCGQELLCCSKRTRLAYNEPSRIEPEKPSLFEQLVFRAVSEGEISIQRGAELLKMPYQEVVSHCCFDEG